MTKRVIYGSIAAIWLLAALISFLPISMDLHRPMQESEPSVTFQLDDQLLTDSTTFDQDLAAMSRASEASSDFMAPLDAYTVMKMANEDEDPGNGNNAEVMSNQPVLAVASSSQQCALDLTPTYAIVSSCISFYFPCLVMLAIYSRLYFYAKMHVQNIKAVTRPVILLGRFEPDPNDSGNNTSESQQQQQQQTQPPHNKVKKKKRRHYQSPTPSGTCAASSSTGNNNYHVSDHKAAVTLGIIMGVFLICWVPFFCVNIVAAFCKTCIPPIVFKILTWLGYSNSAFNPIIYSIFNLDFRLAFQKILTAKTRSYCCHRFPDIYEPGNSRSRGNSGQNGGAGGGGAGVAAQGPSNQLHPQFGMDHLRASQQPEPQQLVSNGNHQVRQANQANCQQTTAPGDNEERLLEPRHNSDEDQVATSSGTSVLVVSTSSGHIISSNSTMKSLHHHHHHIRRMSNSATQRQDSGQHLLSVAEKVV